MYCWYKRATWFCEVYVFVEIKGYYMEHEFDEEAFNELNMYMTSYNKEI